MNPDEPRDNEDDAPVGTAIYLRVARDDRGRLDAQAGRLHAHAAAHDLTITDAYHDVASDTDGDRPGLAALLAAARDGRFDQLLVDRLDRLSRHAHDLARIVDTLNDAQVTVHCSGHPPGVIAVTDDAHAVIGLLDTAAIADGTAPDHTPEAPPADTLRRGGRR